MPRYSEKEAREAVAASKSYSEVLRRLRMRPAGGNHTILKRYVNEIWQIPTDHFEPAAASIRHLHKAPKPLTEILVKGSTYSRSTLKKRLFEEGLKDRTCEMCGQDEIWRGRRMALILDHINGDPEDNRIENLRIVCPNCAATFETHCGRKNRMPPPIRACKRCGREFTAKYARHAYCSRACGMRWDRSAIDRSAGGRPGGPPPEARKVDRPPHQQLLAEIEATSHLAVARRYGVSGDAVRKWVLLHERQMEREAAEGEAAGASLYPDQLAPRVRADGARGSRNGAGPA